MKKAAVVALAGLAAVTGWALEPAGAVHWTGTGDWSDSSHWEGSPGNWSKAQAIIDSGAVNITPEAMPSSTVYFTHLGSDVDADSTMNVSGGYTTATFYMGHTSVNSGNVNTLNVNTGGSFVVTGTSSIGRNAAQAVINVAGGTLDFQGSTYVGNGGPVQINLSAGVLKKTSGNFILGNTGRAVLSQTGGNAFFNQITLASSAKGTPGGTYSISGGDLTVTAFITGPTQQGVFEVAGSGATSICIRALYLADGDTFRVNLDENGSTLVNITATGVSNSFNLSNGSTFEVNALPGFKAAAGAVYDVAFSKGGFLMDGVKFVNNTGVDLEWSVVSKNDGEVLQLAVPKK